MSDKNVLIVGGGVAGLTTAAAIADQGCRVVLIEKENALGGHAAQFVCKAVDGCVKCGACMVEEKIESAASHSNIRIHTGTQLADIKKQEQFVTSFSGEGASETVVNYDAVVVATGFQAFDPLSKPYGYGRFKDVITNLELEHILRREGEVKRPSDGLPPETVAFIQCVGSRDAGINHLWCSKVCCGSSLRMANLIQSKHSDMEVSFFYIDIQTFGKDFSPFYRHMQEKVKLIRAIPADIFLKDRKLQVSYFHAEEQAHKEVLFDLVVLSVGITPNPLPAGILGKVGLAHAEGVFADSRSLASVGGLFAAGTATGPKSIAESIADAGRVASDVSDYLRTQ